MKRALTILLVLGSLAACKEAPTDSTLSGTYSYMSYDSLGTVIVKGWFRLDIADSADISGEWNFMNLTDSEASGSQVGNGILVGGFANGLMIVDLHPDFRDNNLLLIGILDGTRYSGRWEWISFAGISNYGTFQAQRR